MKSRIALAVAALLPLACGPAHLHGPMTIPLTWSPTDAQTLPIGAVAAFKNQRVAVNPVVDSREDRATIGKNIEGKIDRQAKPEWAVTTNTDVGSFLTERLLAVLQTNGITTVTTDPSRVIRLEILRYFVVEGESYKGEVGFRVTVEDGQGRQLWTGAAEGASNRFGRSYTPENYNETLSDAFLEAIKQLLQNPDLLRAVGS